MAPKTIYVVVDSLGRPCSEAREDAKLVAIMARDFDEMFPDTAPHDVQTYDLRPSAPKARTK